jgi:hypothetical protein
MMVGPVGTATCAPSRLFAFGGEAGVMSRPGQLWGVCDHAVISEPGGAQTSGCGLQLPPTKLLVVHSDIHVVVDR